MRKPLMLLFLFSLSVCSFGQTHNSFNICGTDAATKSWREIHGEPALPPEMKVEDDSSLTYVVPVVFHIMHENGPEKGVTLDQVKSQIDMMNQQYNRYGLGYNTDPVGARINIKFCLAQIDPDGSPTSGIDYFYFHGEDFGASNWSYNFVADSLMKTASGWDTKKYLNIWTVWFSVNSGLAGYSYYPEDVAGRKIDGCVVDYRGVGIAGIGSSLETRVTVSHEAGHWLGLYHPWGFKADCSDDDSCADTPRTADSYDSFCNEITSSCGFQRQVTNYMDYSEDACQNLFTQCQMMRMRTNIILYRHQVIDKSNLALTGCSPIFDSLPVFDKVTIYPNPAINSVMIFFDKDIDLPVSVKLFNTAGQVVIDLPEVGIGRGSYCMDLSNVPNGLYQLIVSTTGIYVRKPLLLME